MKRGNLQGVAMDRDAAIDAAFASTIEHTGLDLINPLANVGGDRPAGESGAGDTPTGESTVPWMQGSEQHGAPSTPPTPPSRLPPIPDGQGAGERPIPGVRTQPVTRLNLNQLPPEVRSYAQQLQADYDLRVAAIEDRARGLQDVGEFAGVARHLAQSPELREHVRQWYEQQQGGQGRAPTAPAPVRPDPEEELLASLDPEDQKIVQALEARLEKKYQKALEQKLQPIENDRQVVQAMREENEFLAEFPDWQEYVPPEVLMKAKELKPNEHLSTLFSQLAMRTVMQRVRGGGQPPQPPAPQERPQPPAAPRQPAAPANPALRLMEIARRQAPPSQPRQQPAPVERAITKGPNALDDAFNTVLERLQRG
jgi:hypothetical protein